MQKCNEAKFPFMFYRISFWKFLFCLFFSFRISTGHLVVVIEFDSWWRETGSALNINELQLSFCSLQVHVSVQQWSDHQSQERNRRDSSHEDCSSSYPFFVCRSHNPRTVCSCHREAWRLPDREGILMTSSYLSCTIFTPSNLQILVLFQPHLL